MNNKYIIDPSKKFDGSTVGIAYFDGETYRVDSSGYLFNDNGEDLTIEEYLNHDCLVDKKLSVISSEEREKLSNSYIDSLIAEPSAIDGEDYEQLLNCLPPCRWQTIRGIEFFYLSERLAENIVIWLAKLGDKYCRFHDRNDLARDDLFHKAHDFFKGDL